MAAAPLMRTTAIVLVFIHGNEMGPQCLHMRSVPRIAHASRRI